MLDCESVLVTTATGPGGMSGPLRIDFSAVRQVCPWMRSTAGSTEYMCSARTMVQEYTYEEHARPLSARWPTPGPVRCVVALVYT